MFINLIFHTLERCVCERRLYILFRRLILKYERIPKSLAELMALQFINLKGLVYSKFVLESLITL